MRTHESVAAMAGAYAEEAIQKAREFNAQLDYSENSLMDVEVILGQMARQIEVILAQLARQTPDGEAASDGIGEMCKVWGSYLGEVVRRRFGGEWTVETYPGKQFATLTLSIGGNKLFPTMKVHRRLTQGEDDNVWSFYKMIKARLESAPGSTVQ
jgi:hypothetical protein